MDTAELRALVENITARPGHMSAMGTRVVAVEPGHVHLAIDRRPDLLQFSGHFHGGVIAALADHVQVVRSQLRFRRDGSR
jgi:acyl-coenzyme A thioesterase PaaI-like protein